MEPTKGPVLYVDDDLSGALENLIREELPNYLFLFYTDHSRAISDVEEGLLYRLAFVDLGGRDNKYAGEDFIRVSRKVHPAVPIVVVSGAPLPSQYRHNFHIHDWIGKGNARELLTKMSDAVRRYCP